MLLNIDREVQSMITYITTEVRSLERRSKLGDVMFGLALKVTTILKLSEACHSNTLPGGDARKREQVKNSVDAAPDPL